MPGLKLNSSFGLLISSVSCLAFGASVASVAFAQDPVPGASPVVGLQSNEVKEPAHGKPSETLPRVIKTPAVNLKSGVPVQVRFVPPKHWKINDGAPTWFALFEMTQGKAQVVREYSRSDVKTLKVEFPKLEAGHSYRAQGTFYICQEKGGSVCLMQSADQRIEVSARGKGKLEISLSQAE